MNEGFVLIHIKTCKDDTLSHTPLKKQTQVVTPYKPSTNHHIRWNGN